MEEIGNGRIGGSTIALVLAGWILWGFIPSGPAFSQIFEDDFESGYFSAWALVQPIIPVTAYRFTDLDLRDPHVFVEAVVCFDFTDQELPVNLGPSFNGALEAAFVTDSEPDGFLDTSFLLMFRPLQEQTASGRVDLAAGACTAPVVGTSCMPAAPPGVFDYATEEMGLCLLTEPGSTSGYSPAIDLPSAACFGGQPRDLALSLNGTPITLRDARVGASFVGADPPSSLINGLLMGFLTEADANATPLPSDLPVIGGQPLSILLPGGAGNCAVGDDRDMHLGQSGWWFYLNFTAEPVPYTE